MNNKGQAYVIGVLVLILAIILFIAVVPAMQGLFDETRGCSSFNCAGYVDRDAAATATCGSTNQSYNLNYDESTLGCTMVDLSLPLLILIVVIGLASAFMRGRLGEESSPSPY